MSRRRSALLWLALALCPALALATDPTPGKGGTAWDAGEGVKIRFRGLQGASPMASNALPEVDTSQLPQSRVVLNRGVSRAATGPDHQGMVVYGVCLRAPSAGLPPNIDDLAFDKLNERLQEELGRSGARVDSFSPGRALDKNNLTEQPFAGEAVPPGARPGVKNRLQGKHLLGFVGEPPEMLLCSVACMETSTESGRACTPVVESVAVEATLVPAPRPNVVIRLAYASLRRPLAAAGAVVGLVLIALGFVIILWPARKPAARPVTPPKPA